MKGLRDSLRRRAVSWAKSTDRVAFIKALLVLFMGLALSLTLTGMARFTGLWGGLVSWCKSLVEGCLPYLMTIDLLLFWLTGGLILSGLVYATVKNGLSLIRGYRRIGRLRLAFRPDSTVRLIRDDSSAVAFTHGLLWPKIYLSTGLIKGLGRQELLAVLYHEIHHRRRKDPLRIFALSFLKDALFYLPVGRYLEAKILKLKEFEADMRAARRLESPIPVARALLKLKSGSVALAGGASIDGYELKERIEWLLGTRTGASRERATAGFVLKNIAIVTLILAGLVMPVIATDGYECTTTHCTHHIEKLGEVCQTHCHK